MRKKLISLIMVCAMLTAVLGVSFPVYAAEPSGANKTFAGFEYYYGDYTADNGQIFSGIIVTKYSG